MLAPLLYELLKLAAQGVEGFRHRTVRIFVRLVRRLSLARFELPSRKHEPCTYDVTIAVVVPVLRVVDSHMARQYARREQLELLGMPDDVRAQCRRRLHVAKYDGGFECHENPPSAFRMEQLCLSISHYGLTQVRAARNSP